MELIKLIISSVTLTTLLISLLSLVLGGLDTFTTVSFILGLIGIILDTRAEIGTLKAK